MPHRTLVLRAFHVVAALALFSLLAVAPAFAADGVRLLPTSDPLADAWQNQPGVSGPIVAFCATPEAGEQSVYASNAGVRPATTWSMRGLFTGTQFQPCVLTRGDVVRVIWAQNDAASEIDLYIWEGSKTGVAGAGFPKKLVDHAYGRNAAGPSIGVARVGAEDHVIVAWDDEPSINGGGIAVVRWLDLTVDTDLDGTPDYKDAEFDATTAGTQADPAAAASQWRADVGPKGIFWLDARTRVGNDETSIGRLDLSGVAPVASLFHSEAAGSGFDATRVRATGTGAAWLRLADYPGAGIEPVAKPVGGAMNVVTFLGRPQEFDVEGSAYALAAGHGGATDLDADIFFYSPAVRYSIGVCTVGTNDSFDEFKTQEEPAISTAPGGYRVIWTDRRHSTSADDHRTIYQALVPTVTLTANKTRVRRGRSVTLTARVTPSYKGAPVRFQTGARHSMTALWGTSVWFTNLSTKKKKALGTGSKTTWTWSPTKKGTYYFRVSFGGGTRYVGRAGYGANHVPAGSRWMKIVVK
jgi:hypothetical protein